MEMERVDTKRAYELVRELITTLELAPGAPITAPGLGGTLSTFFGTSQAAPHAAGCAAAAS